MLEAVSNRGLLRALRCGAVLANLVGLGALAAACSGEEPQTHAGTTPAEHVGAARSAIAGRDGAFTVAQANTIVNHYTALAADAAQNETTIQVASAAALGSQSAALTTGDLLLVIQMQGATISTANDDRSWGQVSATNGAGFYELVEVRAVSANLITLSCGLQRAYDKDAQTQVVRVPQYSTLTIASGASITAPAWNGATGGVVAIHARDTVTLTGDISVSGLGFRGGRPDNASASQNTDVASYFSLAASDGARKGEGIAGPRAEFGRAPAANGGGGGNSHNGGGGGGANARAGAAWTGQGVFDTTVTGGGKAWPLDPNYSAKGSEGGGRGGYTYSANNSNATNVAPGKGAWGGNRRRERGGLGGHPVDNNPASRLFFGGGGGAGDSNNDHGGRGGNGGGLVLLLASSVSGSGRILANGEAGADADSTAGGSKSGDAPGGGGGGGTVVLRATTVSGISVQAQGGTGGAQIIDNGNEGEGPGGGGGGGFVSVSDEITVSVAGGRGGTTNAASLREFPSNGATSGGGGQSELGAAAKGQVPYCADTTAPNTTITSAPAGATSDATADFTFAASDASATFECSLDAAAFSACTTPLTTPALSDGPHTFRVRARNALGNVDPSPDSRSFTLDTTPPDTQIDTHPSRSTTELRGHFTFSSRDGGVRFECKLDSAAFAACTTPLVTAVLDSGPHTFQVRALDAAGNVDASPAIWSFTITIVDSDTDGLSDDDEAALGTDAHDADSDDDGVLDGAEPEAGVDSDGDGLINALDPDSDDDGLFDGTELGLDCGNPDTNVARHLCIPDADSGATTTAPSNPDSDGGGVRDGSEDYNLDGAVNGKETDPSVGHGADDASVLDRDRDGLSDGLEATLHSDPRDTDSDDDGAPDSLEPNPSADGDGDGLVDVLDVDSDDDGSFDGTELGQACSDPGTNVAIGHCRADQAPTTKTSAVDPDSDRGGVRDGSEDANLDGKLDPSESDPTLGQGADDGDVVDSDQDGLGDDSEAELGSNPNDADSDDDGLLDGLEPNPSDDNDGDGVVEVLDRDSDDDGLFDGTEAGLDCANVATDPKRRQCVADADRGATTTLVLVRDTDRGGVTDGEEDANLDGAVERGERNPLDRSDDDQLGGEAGAGGVSGAPMGPESAGAGAEPGEGGDGSGGASGSPSSTAGNGGSSATGGASGGVSASGGSSAAGMSSAGADAKVVILGGGLCAYRPAPRPNQLGWVLVAAFATAFARRRRPRRAAD